MENTKIRAPVTLKGGNYLLWARTMKTILCGRGFWPHIIKSEAPRETTTNEEGLEIVLVDEDKWFQEDQMVLSVLQNSLEASILEGYSYCETPKDLWETLQNVFGNQSNLSRVFEIKKAINELTQGDMEFTQHFGKFRSLWAELEMLRPNTLDPAVINERREQDKVFGLLFTLNPGYNDLIKHLLRADKLQNLEEVCSQIQKEQGSLGLFGSKGELVSGNSSELASANRGNFNTNRGKAPWCDHCKKSGHAKEKCWILHPHLRPARREPRANHATGENLGGQEQAGTSSQALGGNGAAMMASSDLVRRSDLDALIKALKESSGNAYHALSSLKPLIVDSGASHHMISDSKLMKNIEPALGNVIIANGDKIPVKGLGDLELFSKKSKAFYMPTFTSNLLSVKKATTDLNCYAIFGPNDVHFQDIETSRVLGHGGTKDGLYVLEDTKLSTPLASHFSSVLVNANNAIWHARLGHPHSRALGLLLPSISFKNDEWEACILGKHCKSVFPKSNTIYENCFDLVHSDVWTSPCLSRENQKYFVTFIDEKSKYTWLTLLPSKDRVLEAFTNFQNYVTNHYNAKIKIFRSDNGGEYTSHAFKQHLAKHGIIHQTSCPYTPQQNGVAERKNRHLMEVARSMMFHTNVPKRFWSDAVVLACYLINRIPTKILQDSSPFEVLNKNKPSINHLRVFGCVFFVLIGEQRSKLDPKSVKGMFIGYSITQKGYKCYIPETKKVLVSRDVKFVESKGYYEDKNWEDIQDLTHSPSDRANNLRIILERLGVSNSQGHTNSPNPNPEPTQQQETSQHEEEEHLQEEENIQANIQENILEEGEIPSDHEEETTLSEEENLSTSDHNEGSTSQEAPIALRRSQRQKFPPSNWKNTRVYYNSQAVAHPIQAVCTIAHFPEEHQVFLGQIDQHWIPQTYEEAIEHQVWRDAIAAERQAMEHNHTWEEGELPKGKKAVTSKWVFTIKYKSNGDIERYKARLVARGFTQTYGEDYRDTFAPVAKLHTVRVVLSLATNLEWELWQMDVKNAFLQGELEEEVYMKPPPGLEDHNAPGKVFKLKKAIYGLKQSPRAWYHKLSTTLLDRGFKKSEADNTLFTLPSKEGIVVILVYVDDIIISGNDKVGIQETKAFLKSVFDIKDLGELKYFLGIEVCRSKEGLFLSQRKYTLDLLSQVGKLGAKPAKTPLEDDYKANRKGELDNKPFEDVTQYRRLVGKLIYLTITRPDICFAVNVVSQHMQAPTLHHWNMVTRILKYLKGAPGQGIWMGCNKNTELVGYCDADYAGDTKDRRSTTGYCTFIGGNLVTWRSKKQKVVSLSSAEAEYRAMRKLTTELMWLKALLKDFGIDTPKPITMHCDNQAAIHIASNSVFHERTKHIEVDCHKVREQVQLGVILPCYTESEEQLADIFTKVSPKEADEEEEKEEKEATIPEEDKWFQEDQAVLALLQNSLEASILEGYSYCETAKELWDTLKNVYGNESNLTRVFEVKKAINELSQEDLEFTKHFGKFRSLWSELESLRPGTLDPKILHERREQDKVFGLLLTLNPSYNDLIKHLLRSEKLPTLDEVCSKIQKEQGSSGLFGGKGELAMANKGEVVANKGVYRQEDKKSMVCEHCKKKGHTKDKCWILHPHLKPAKFKEPRAHLSLEGQDNQDQSGSSKSGGEASTMSSGDYVRKSDLEALIKSIASLKESGITYFSHQPSNSSMVIDSGASHHMISNPNLLNNIEPALGNVIIANGDKVPIKGIGNLRVFDRNSKAFYMPKFTSNLLSVKRATKDLNCYAIFGPNDVYFQDIETGKLIGEGGSKGELYVLEDASPSSNTSPISFKSHLGVSFNVLWHARLGHPHSRALKLMLPSISFDHSSCEACILGKHCKSVFPKSFTIYEKCFDLVHSDVWTSPCVSRDNNKYFVTFIDEKSKYTWITLLPSKDRVFEAFTNFQNYVTNQFNAKIKVLRTDNGGEYTSHKFKEHLAKHGIIHQTSCPYTPQQNGVAERKNRHLMEVARSMMFHTSVPRRYWGDAVMTACYLINRTPTKVLKDLSPFEVLNNTRPSIDHLRVFGCVCFVLVPGEQRNKLDAKSTRCMFLGYSTTQKGYKCYDPTSNRTFVSRDVKFLEDQGYTNKKDWEDLKDLAHSTTDRAASLKFLLDHLGNQSPSPRDNARSSQDSTQSSQPPTRSSHDPELQENESQPHNVPHDEDKEEEEVTIEPNNSNQEEETSLQDDSSESSDEEEEIVQCEREPTPPLRRSKRVRYHPSNWKNTRVYFNQQAVAHPIQAMCSLALVPQDHQAFQSKISLIKIPETYEEAMQTKEWRDAVEDEIGAMKRNHTWDEEKLPSGKKTVSSKWVFTIKYKSNGDIERYKARLVARGFTQTYGADYKETFAPVAKLHTVRVVLSLATNLSWDLWQMDVKNAFLQGELEDDVYMTPPPGLEATIDPGKVWRLRKAIYGLKQSPRAWYHKLSRTLKDHGFKKSESDHTLFTLRSSQGIVVVLIYVDDLIISGDNKEGIISTKAFLKSTFDIKDLGELKYFLGIEVCRSPEGLFLSQRKYTLDLLHETGSMDAKPAKTPLEEGYKVDRKGEHDEKFQDAPLYRKLVGKLIYLTNTRPDICFAVNQVSQHMQAPTVYHWSMVERILRYLKGTSGQGIWMGKNSNTEIVGYCDADYAGDRMDRRSTTGYCTFIGGNLVTWKTKKQKVVSCSSAESEYRAMKQLTNELTWLKALLKDFGVEQDTPITMHCDNKAAIYIASNSVFHERTKHIEVDCHKVREKIVQGVTLPCYTRSEDQLADIFTKAASLKVFNEVMLHAFPSLDYFISLSLRGSIDQDTIKSENRAHVRTLDRTSSPYGRDKPLVCEKAETSPTYAKASRREAHEPMRKLLEEMCIRNISIEPLEAKSHVCT
ncbi:Integrase catalytic core [Arabidopsis thaliana x Arabidopsis arenosa]|uniref:Integrase catalytic core n=1 Tax=Arabidopsis thaliana x Arabidopsis arenosa TaxID=1240361 RepID=A0A8T2C7R6_9BRAS|nr:Integrase catalytic core [Arabidopsis thaliana x Arabidopsis arenosa]